MKFPFLFTTTHNKKINEIEKQFLQALDKEQNFSMRLMGALYRINLQAKDECGYQEWLANNSGVRHIMGIATQGFVAQLEAMPEGRLKQYLQENFLNEKSESSQEIHA